MFPGRSRNPFELRGAIHFIHSEFPCFTVFIFSHINKVGCFSCNVPSAHPSSPTPYSVRTSETKLTETFQPVPMRGQGSVSQALPG